MNMYRVSQRFSEVEITKNTVTRKTDKTVSFINSYGSETKELIHSSTVYWFDNLIDAKNFALEVLESKIDRTEKQLELEKQNKIKLSGIEEL